MRPSTAARCEQPGLRTLSTAAASGESVVTLGLVPGGTQAGGLGSGTVVDGPVAWARPHPAEVSAVGPSHGPSSGGSAVTVQGGGFDARGPIGQRAIRFLIGLVGVAILWQGLGLVLPRGETIVPYVLRYLRYGLMGLWVAGVAPYLFIRFGLAERFKS